VQLKLGARRGALCVCTTNWRPTWGSMYIYIVHYIQKVCSILFHHSFSFFLNFSLCFRWKTLITHTFARGPGQAVPNRSLAERPDQKANHKRVITKRGKPEMENVKRGWVWGIVEKGQGIESLTQRWGQRELGIVS